MIRLTPCTPDECCDTCVGKDGEHYCAFHDMAIREMDKVKCKNWADRETGRAKNEREE